MIMVSKAGKQVCGTYVHYTRIIVEESETFELYNLIYMYISNKEIHVLNIIYVIICFVMGNQIFSTSTVVIFL